MKLFGITGGIGMGKSVSADLLRRSGVLVVDTDDIARQVVARGQPALKEIENTFGREVIDSAGDLRRKELAARVFASDQARAQLEAILHPRIRTAWQGQVSEWEKGGAACGVVVIPLLFETGAAPLFHFTVCVACSEAAQSERLRARGWSAREIAQRIRAQMPVARKMELANYAVWTEGSIQTHQEQLERILAASEQT